MVRRLLSSEQIVTVLSEEEPGCERAKHDARMAHAGACERHASQ